MSSVTQDSSYSWFVAFVCSGLNFLMIGFIKIDGLLFVETMSYFNVNRKDASVALFVCNIARSIAGMIGGFVGQTLGLRQVMLSGCLLFSIGLSCCFLAKDILTFYILWGGFAGAGIGLCATLIPQVLNVFFKQHYSKASGITVAGINVGGLILSPLTAFVLDKYGLLGTFLILGGIMLHGLPLVLMIRFPTNSKKPTRRKILETISEKGEKDENKFECKGFYSVQKSETGLSQNEDSCPRKPSCYDNLYYEHNDSNSDAMNGKHELDHDHNSRNKSSEIFIISNSSIGEESCRNPENHPGDSCNSKTTHCGEDKGSSSIKENQNQSFNFASLKIYIDISYHIITFGYCSATFLVIIYNSVLLDICTDRGITLKDSIVILLVFFTVDLLTRMTCGYVTDAGYMSRSNFCATSFLVSAISSLCFAWSPGYITMAVSVSFQGLAIGCVYSVCIALVPEYIEKEYQTIAMGSALIYLIPFCVLTPYLLGYFRDELKSYNLLLYFLGGVGILNAILLLLLPHVFKWRSRKKKIETTQEQT